MSELSDDMIWGNDCALDGGRQRRERRQRQRGPPQLRRGQRARGQHREREREREPPGDGGGTERRNNRGRNARGSGPRRREGALWELCGVAADGGGDAEEWRRALRELPPDLYRAVI
eukprot:gene8029-65164_t